MNYQDLGERVRTCRHRMKLTQAELAERMDVSHSFVGHMERGTRAISLETFVTLCNVLEVSPTYLLEGSLKNSDECLPDEVRERVAQLLLQLSLDIVKKNGVEKHLNL